MSRFRVAKASAIACGVASLTPAMINSALAQQASSTTTLPEVDVSAPHKHTRQTTHATHTTTHAPAESAGSAVNSEYHTTDANLGPLGNKPIQDTPASVTVVPQGLIANQQVKTVNDTLRFLPSVEIRDQQGFEVSRPQARGFQGSIVQNTRLDGLNIIGTTAIPAENLSGIQVLNGLAGSLYGPAPPAGVFNYTLARPTDSPLMRYTQGFDSSGVYTEHADLGGRSQDGKVAIASTFCTVKAKAGFPAAMSSGRWQAARSTFTSMIARSSKPTSAITPRPDSAFPAVSSTTAARAPCCPRRWIRREWATGSRAPART